ncbi:MAG TPA: ankyrin repeat domain-containing protein [Candidatus Ozemobacteraceae bacterium]
MTWIRGTGIATLVFAGALSLVQPCVAARDESAVAALVGTHDAAVLTRALDLDRERIRMIDEEGCTLLHRAAEDGWLEGIRILVSRGAPLDAPSLLRFKPLHMAAAAGKTAAVDLLLALGAPATTDDGRGTTVLHVAAVQGRLDVCRMLLERGAVVNASNTGGETPLHWAVDDGHEPVVRALLEAGADPLARTADGRTPLDIARTKGYTALVDLLSDAERTAKRRPSGAAVPRPVPAVPEEPLYKEPATLPALIDLFQ